MPHDDSPGPADEPESESLEKKQQVDPTNRGDMLDIVKAVVALANTRGGRIVIGDESHPVPKEHLPYFDGARVHDKVATYVEPPVADITCSVEVGGDIVVLKIGESTDKPHVFKSDGSYPNPTDLKRQLKAFYRGTILVRHASKTEIMCRADFDRFLAERQARLFDNVKIVFEAPPEATVTVGPPSATTLQVTSILDTQPFDSLEQELRAGVKAWKTSSQLLNEQQVYKAYAMRHAVTDGEIVELLLRSSLDRWLPPFHWASKLTLERLQQILQSVVDSARHPADRGALKVAALLPPDAMAGVFAAASASEKTFVRSHASAFQELSQLQKDRGTKIQRLTKKLFATGKVEFKIGDTPKSMTDAEITDEDATRLADAFSSSTPSSQDKAVLKRMDLTLYGPVLPGED